MTPNTQEYNAVDDLVDPVIESLIARDIAYIEDADAIEDKYFLDLGHVLAGAALPEFGLQDDVSMVAKALKGEQNLEIISSMRPTYEILEVQAY